ncbi:hypothetical protein [Lysinibacillus xylanilyticus]|uniref:Uncharacterized protein n=1 Tax=Lysinibacillus xylanilyticus TaxID=582475 RepID=A0ABT4EMX5_9BACI|nr:hypothetical protein [Lysinibacillus xylanilyticus]MCY9547019.1 hypothetical protein [Lysinibacillus xylanilyticus]MED3801613.1 hypothetical protein [Lysinibacillus xylanilyticus]
MDGDAIVWIVLLLSIVICDYLASYLYKNKKIPLWASAIGMALLIPVIVGSFVYLGVSYAKAFEPDNTREGIAFAGGFMALILALNAIIMFVIGVILNIYTFVKNKRE